MKKTIAILLLSIHLFNFVGYAAIYNYFIQQSENKIQRTIDSRAYDKTTVTILKTPLHLPYYSGSAEFEKLTGEVDIAGTHYTYIERKVSRDTLYLVCLLNTEKTALSKAKNECIKETSPLPSDGKKDNPSSTKKSVVGSEYPPTVLEYSFTSNSSANNTIGFKRLSNLPSGVLAIPYNPPDLA